MAAETTAEELTRRIGEVEPHINAFVHIDEQPQPPARPGGRLSGTAVAVKDNVATQGAPWGCGSATRRDDPAAERDAEVVRRLREAGATVVGTTNLDEFAMGASTESSAWGPTHNPWNTDRSPGGSSGGSAAAVAAYGVVAVGTDTGGSIREPASQCGAVGVKPTNGSVPLDGVVPFAPTLDTVGPLALTVAEAASLHDVLANTGERMRAAADDAVRAPALADVTVGVIPQMSGDRNSPEVRARFERACAELAARGAQFREAPLPRTGEALGAYFTLTSVEALMVLESHALLGELGEQAHHRLEIGRATSATDEGDDALLVREMVTHDLASAFADCDVLVSPTMPLVAPLLGRSGVDDPLAAPRTDWWTVEANLAGVPAMSVPCGLGADSGLPVGLQLIAPAGEDARLYRVAASLEPDLWDT